MSSANSPIGIFDSGIGGLTVANAVVRLLDQESIIYFGDTARAPYGPQSAEKIIEYNFEISRFLIDQGVKIIVIACNTASAAALCSLREEMPAVLFVGMEPAVKPAVHASKSKKIGVLATQGTFASQRYATLIDRYASGFQVFEDPCDGLVNAIEAGHWAKKSTRSLLESIIGPMLDKGVDTLVLGCTHYPLVADLILEIAGPEVKIIDPAPAIARRVKSLLADHDLLATDNHPSTMTLYSSGSYTVMEQIANQLLKDKLLIKTAQIA